MCRKTIKKHACFCDSIQQLLTFATISLFYLILQRSSADGHLSKIFTWFGYIKSKAKGSFVYDVHHLGSKILWHFKQRKVF